MLELVKGLYLVLAADPIAYFLKARRSYPERKVKVNFRRPKQSVGIHNTDCVIKDFLRSLGCQMSPYT